MRSPHHPVTFYDPLYPIILDIVGHRAEEPGLDPRDQAKVIHHLIGELSDERLAILANLDPTGAPNVMHVSVKEAAREQARRAAA